MWETFELDEDDVVAVVGAKWLGLAVRRRRYRLRLSQRRLENLCGIDQTVISRLENGRLKGIRFARLLTLIGTLGGLDDDSPLPWFEDPHPRPFVSLMGDDDDLQDDVDDEPAPGATQEDE